MSGGKKKRPAALNLANANPLPGTLQTPKDLAQDIAKHCLSPTVPRGISKEMLKRAQEIEHQQRQLILQRGLTAYDRDRQHDEDPEPKSQSSTPTSNSNLSVDSVSSAPVPSTTSDPAANPPRGVPRSVPGSATSLNYGRRPWELSSNPVPHTAVPLSDGMSTSAGASTSGSAGTAGASTNEKPGTPSGSTLQERRGARPVQLDVKALKRDAQQSQQMDDDPEARAISDEDTTLPSIHKLASSVHPAKKQRFLALCEEMWELLHS